MISTTKPLMNNGGYRYLGFLISITSYAKTRTEIDNTNKA